MVGPFRARHVCQTFPALGMPTNWAPPAEPLAEPAAPRYARTEPLPGPVRLRHPCRMFPAPSAELVGEPPR